MKILVVADPSICKDDFLERIYRLCEAKIDAILLRAKHLNESQYHELATKILKICAEFEVEFIVNHFINVALNLNSSLWLTSLNLKEILPNAIKNLPKIYAPAHDINEATNSAKIADVLIASHIFATPCKDNLEPKGVEFIKILKTKFDREIYALGGINEHNFKECLKFGANGVCIMSLAMRCKNAKELIAKFK